MNTSQQSFANMSLDDLETFMFSQSREAPKKPVQPAPMQPTEHEGSHNAVWAVFENEMAEYRAAADAHRALTSEAYQSWLAKLKDLVAKNEPQEVFMLAYQFAYHQHHSAGLHEVRYSMVEIMELVTSVRAIS